MPESPAAPHFWRGGRRGTAEVYRIPQLGRWALLKEWDPTSQYHQLAPITGKGGLKGVSVDEVISAVKLIHAETSPAEGSAA